MQIILEIVKFFYELILKLFSRLIEKFTDLNICEKIIVINCGAAFFAIILPVAKYYIFETYFTINNPLAVYMIGIVLIMLITEHYRNKITFFIRETVNIYYLFWVIYLHLSGELTKAPYIITPGYYLNIIVPLIFILFSFLSFRFYEKG